MIELTFFIDHDEPQSLKDTIKRSFDDSVSYFKTVQNLLYSIQHHKGREGKSIISKPAPLLVGSGGVRKLV